MVTLIATALAPSMDPSGGYSDLLQAVARVARNVFPLMLVLAIAYHMSVRVGLDRLTLMILSASVFITEVTIENGGALNRVPELSSISAILAPFLTCTIFKILSNPLEKRMNLAVIHPSVARAVIYLIPFLLTALICVPLLLAASVTLGAVLKNLIYLDSPTLSNLVFLEVIHTSLWFVGVNGGNVIPLFIGTEFYDQQIAINIEYEEFTNIFVGFGGTGSVLGLVLAILAFADDRRMRSLAYICMPFAIFNISEPIVFGLPVILNPRLFIPFLLAPVVNIIIGFGLINADLTVFLDREITWLAPVGISGYLYTESVGFALFQTVLLMISTLIYMPFVLSITRSAHDKKIREILHERINFDTGVNYNYTLSYQNEQNDSIIRDREERKILNEVRCSDFLVFYQPKFDIDSLECVGFEALLRLRREDGTVVGPSFLPIFERVGCALPIDSWVCDQVIRDLPHFTAKGGNRTISVNLHPTSVCDSDFVDRLIRQFKDKPVSFEIVERGFATDPDVLEQANRMDRAGLSLEVDDFGSGYANLNGLALLPVKTIKLDRSLLLQAQSDRGAVLYREVARLCRTLDFHLVAEGVETSEQVEFVRSCGIRCAQGWYFGKAVPRDEAENQFCYSALS